MTSKRNYRSKDIIHCPTLMNSERSMMYTESHRHLHTRIRMEITTMLTWEWRLELHLML